MPYDNIAFASYRRKSTDQEDMQQASLPAQTSNITRTQQSQSLNIVREFEESVSAKTERTRKEFNEMIRLIKAGKIQ